MSKVGLIMHCIQFITFLFAGIVAGIKVFDSGAMALYLALLATFIANISFYIEVYVKDGDF